MRPLIAFFLLIAINLLWMHHATSGLTLAGAAIDLAVSVTLTAVYAKVQGKAA